MPWIFVIRVTGLVMVVLVLDLCTIETTEDLCQSRQSNMSTAMMAVAT